MKRLKIRVTQKHIDNGEQGERLACALALAVIDTPLPGGLTIYGASIGGASGSSFVVGGKRVRFRLTRRARQFISDFDKIGKFGVHPSTFYFEIPEGAL